MLPRSEIIFAVLVGVIVIGAFKNRPNSRRPTWSENLHGWQKLFGAIAVLLAILIVMNPEFLALGLLGDTAFFDVLVLALTLQMHTYAAGFWNTGVRWGLKFARFAQARVYLSAGVLGLLFAPVGSVITAMHKAVQRTFSCA